MAALDQALPAERRRPQGTRFPRFTLPLSIKIAQKPYLIGSLGPKALKYESLKPKGKPNRNPNLLDLNKL